MLTENKLKADDIFKAEKLLQIAYGKEYQKEKFSLLWNLVQEDKWTVERLEFTVKQFIKTNKWKDWTVADFYNLSNIKLYPYSWYLKKLSEGVPDKNLECYRINNVALWRERDGLELPYERVL